MNQVLQKFFNVERIVEILLQCFISYGHRGCFFFALQNYEFDHVTITDDSNLESEGGTLFVKVLVQKIFKSKTECHNFYMLAST